MKAEIPFVLDSAVWPAFLVDANGRIRHANRASIETFGAAVEAETCTIESLWSLQNSENSVAFLNRFLASPGPRTIIHLTTKGNTSTAFDCLAAPYTLWNLKYLVLQLFEPIPVVTAPAPKAPDTTPPIEAISAHKQKLECALQLTRTVALDFNNALTSILGHTSHLLGQMEPGHPFRTSLLEVEKSAEKAAEIAHDLALFSLQEKEERVHANANLNTLARRVVDLFQKSSPAGILWTTQLSPELYSAAYDEAKLQQVLTKVLENAVQAFREKGKIHIETRNLDVQQTFSDGTARLREGSYIRVEIMDTGIGIPPEVLPRVFEPFFSTKPGHRGLGLAWVYGIVTNHGGSLTVSSTRENGTSVRIYLPANKKLVRDHEFKDKDLRGKETILMVDDEEILLTMGQVVLSSFGYTVLTARSGRQAIEIFTKQRDQISLVLTDMVMPSMSGRELVEELRRLSSTVKILCMSGYVRGGKAQSEELYLQKPFTSQDLLRKVKQVLSPQAGH